MKLDEQIQAADEVIATLMEGLYNDEICETYETLRMEAKEGIENTDLPTFYHEKYNEIIDEEIADCEIYDQGGLSK